MIPTTRIPSALSLGLVLALSNASVLQAQARLTVPCTVRIRPIAAADYDLGQKPGGEGAHGASGEGGGKPSR